MMSGSVASVGPHVSCHLYSAVAVHQVRAQGRGQPPLHTSLLNGSTLSDVEILFFYRQSGLPLSCEPSLWMSKFQEDYEV